MLQSSKYKANGDELAAQEYFNEGKKEQNKEFEVNMTNSNGCSEDSPEKNSEQQSCHNGATQNTSKNGGCSIFKSMEEDMFYKMHDAHPGLAIIFNHYEFDKHYDIREGTESELDVREGTEYDLERLQAVLNKLGFAVRPYTDLTYEEITTVIQEAQKENHQDIDCLVLAVLTHGEVDGQLAAKNKKYPFSVLWEPFTDANCPSLKGKPRLFFVQACRGKQAMEPVLLNNQTETDRIIMEPVKPVVPTGSPNLGVTAIPNIPEHFLVAYATGEGYSAWRQRDGTWFIQNLSKMLEKYADQCDLNHILTRVLREVAIEHQTHAPIFDESGMEIGFDAATHETKQMPIVITKLLRSVIFKR